MRTKMKKTLNTRGLSAHKNNRTMSSSLWTKGCVSKTSPLLFHELMRLLSNISSRPSFSPLLTHVQVISSMVRKICLSKLFNAILTSKNSFQISSFPKNVCHHEGLSRSVNTQYDVNFHQVLIQIQMEIKINSLQINKSKIFGNHLHMITTKNRLGLTEI